MAPTMSLIGAVLLIALTMICSSPAVVLSSEDDIIRRAGVCAEVHNTCMCNTDKFPGATNSTATIMAAAQPFLSGFIGENKHEVSVLAAAGDTDETKVFVYFNCIEKSCRRCYAKAVKRQTNGGCPDNVGGCIALDDCLLRFETYDFYSGGDWR